MTQRKCLKLILCRLSVHTVMFRKWACGCGREHHSLQSLSSPPKLPGKGQALLITTRAAHIILHLFYFGVRTTCCSYPTWWISEWLHFRKEAKETKLFYYFYLAARGYFETFCKQRVWEVSMRGRKKIDLRWNARIKILFSVLLYSRVTEKSCYKDGPQLPCEVNRVFSVRMFLKNNDRIFTL